jgi:hypothetical protein
MPGPSVLASVLLLLPEARTGVDYFWQVGGGHAKVTWGQVTDFHLDQYYGTAGPLGDWDYVGYYDYATCWNASNEAP